jgi:hypothetical protein
MRSRSSIVRGVLLAVSLPAIVALGATQLGCGSSQEMRSASGVPASQGTVRATEGDNGNTNLSIRVKHLAPPQQIASEATVYVVWIQPRDFPRQNMGALILSADLEGSLDTVTPHSRFMVSITPESIGTARRPLNAPVFTADVDRS